MICLTRPDGGQTWVHESRLDEYLGRGFKLPSPPQADPASEKATAVQKKSTRRIRSK